MKFGRDRHLPAMCCPACGDVHNAATCVGEDAGPTPGDLTVCITCGTPLAFTTDLGLRRLTEPEERWAATSPRVLAIRWAIDRLGKKKARH